MKSVSYSNLIIYGFFLPVSFLDFPAFCQKLVSWWFKFHQYYTYCHNDIIHEGNCFLKVELSSKYVGNNLSKDLNKFVSFGVVFSNNMTLQHCSETLWERGRLRGLNSKRNYIQLVHDWYQIRTFKQRLNFCVLWYRTYSLVYSFGPAEFRFDFSPIKDVHLLRVKAIFTNYCVKNKTS